MNLDQILALTILVVFSYLSYVDMKDGEHKVYLLPLLTLLVIGASRFVFTLFDSTVPIIVPLTSLFLSVIPVFLLSLYYHSFKKFGLADVLAFLSIGLFLPVSPFFISPLVFVADGTFINSFLILIIASLKWKSLRGKGTPFMPFITVAYLISLLGDPHIVLILKLIGR